jgi:CubicO group peptidase (beta-lactamase class C family)
VRLLKPETVEKARTLRTGAMVPPGDFGKIVFGAPQQYGLGYEFARDGTPMLGKGSFGHAGAGGRIGFAHPESGTAVAYVANTMLTVPSGPDPRWVGWTNALKDVVGAS